MGWKAACGLISAAILLAGCGHTTKAGSGSSPAASSVPSFAGPPVATAPSTTGVVIPTPLLPSPSVPSPSPGVRSSPVPTHGPSPSPTPVPTTGAPVSVIHQSDTGKAIPLALGSTAQLQLPETMHWNAPQVEGSAVTLTPVTFVRDPGYLAWTVKAVSAGQATITSAGSPNCSPGMACPMFAIEFRVTIQVSPA